MKNVALHNLGCKVNSYEMDVMQQMLQAKGYGIVPFDSIADIYIVNTCSVTNIADRKSRQMLHQAKARNPEAIVVAVGCYVQTAGDTLLEDAAVDLVIGNNRKHDLVNILEQYLSERDGHSADLIDINAPCEYEEMTLTCTAEHTRAYIKIQDGCNQFCSYCIIPFARGRVRSRKVEDIRAEIEGIAKAGYKEIVLTGIHCSSYGIDFDDEAFARGECVVSQRETGQRDYASCSKLFDLIEKIHDIDGIERIRLSSFEPRIMTAENAARLAALPKVCPHFHMSLQSGSDATLKRMNRHYTSAEFAQCVENLRRVYDMPAITTDVIVGFPGETETEFAETRAFLDRMNLYEMHIFKYSKRKGTRAATMPDQVPGPVSTARSATLLAMEKEKSEEFRRRFIGKKCRVLFEDAKVIDGVRYQVGHTPEYVKAAFPCEEDLSNTIYEGTGVEMLTDELLLIR